MYTLNRYAALAGILGLYFLFSDGITRSMPRENDIRGCWFRDSDKINDNTLGLCFESNGQMHIVTGNAGPELDASPTTWAFKDEKAVVIDSEICNLIYTNYNEIKLSECSFNGSFTRK